MSALQSLGGQEEWVILCHELDTLTIWLRQISYFFYDFHFLCLAPTDASMLELRKCRRSCPFRDALVKHSSSMHHRCLGGRKTKSFPAAPNVSKHGLRSGSTDLRFPSYARTQQDKSQTRDRGTSLVSNVGTQCESHLWGPQVIIAISRKEVHVCIDLRWLSWLTIGISFRQYNSACMQRNRQ